MLGEDIKSEELSDLIRSARERFSEYHMDDLPEELKRNSKDYYYLSVYPSLQEMYELNKEPAYPDKISSMYIHTPFCSGICSFCSYFVNALGGDSNKIQLYFELLKKEFDIHKEKTEFKLGYLYFGGGTPSLIPAHVLDDFLGHLQKSGALDQQLLGTIELHPEFFDNPQEAQKFIDVLKKYKISRVSIGYESSSINVLETTNRRHGKNFLLEAVRLIKGNGLSFNIDLMYGMPGMSLQDWETALMDVISVNPDSITPYFLFVDKRTGMYKDVKSGKVVLPTHREIQTQHIMSQILLEEHGYYELPNDFFAKIDGKFNDGVLSQDVLPSESASLPLGAGSYGYFNRTQFYNQFNLDKHKEHIETGVPPIWRGYEMDDETLFRRDIMFLLKNSQKIDRELFLKKYDKDIFSEFKPLLTRLAGLELISITNDAVILTAKGRLVVEEIACQFKDPRIQTNLESGLLLERHNFSPTYRKLNNI